MPTRSRPTPLNPAPFRAVQAARQPEPPIYLSDAMQSWWTVVLENYELDRHHLHLLEAACTAWDRMVQARSALAANGLTFTDDRAAPKARPEVAIERDARIAFARLVRELDLDDVPPAERRPPALRSDRR